MQRTPSSPPALAPHHPPGGGGKLELFLIESIDLFGLRGGRGEHDSSISTPGDAQREPKETPGRSKGAKEKPRMPQRQPKGDKARIQAPKYIHKLPINCHKVAG